MPTTPKGGKRPADVVSNAVHVMKVLTGEADDGAPEDGKDKAAQAMGRKGGAARAKAIDAGAAGGDRESRCESALV